MKKWYNPWTNMLDLATRFDIPPNTPSAPERYYSPYNSSGSDWEDVFVLAWPASALAPFACSAPEPQVSVLSQPCAQSPVPHTVQPPPLPPRQTQWGIYEPPTHAMSPRACAHAGPSQQPAGCLQWSLLPDDCLQQYHRTIMAETSSG
jgi:hypothetical protein